MKKYLTIVEEFGDKILFPCEWILLQGLVLASFYVFSPQGRIGGMVDMEYRSYLEYLLMYC